eukprot:g4390.t1
MQRLSGMIIQKESILYQQIAYVSEKFYLQSCESTSATHLKPDKIVLPPVSSSGNKSYGNSARSSVIVQDSMVPFEILWNKRLTPKNIAAWPQKSICNITPTRMTQQIDLDVFKRSKRQRKEVKRYEVPEDDIRKRTKIDTKDGSTSKNHVRDGDDKKKEDDAAKKIALLIKENSLTGRLRLFAEILIDNCILKPGCVLTLRTRRSQYSAIIGDMGTVRAGKKVHSSVENWVRRCLNRVEGAEDMVFYEDKSLRDWVEVVQNIKGVDKEKILKERRSGEVVPSPANAACENDKNSAGNPLEGVKRDFADEDLTKTLGNTAPVVRDASIEAKETKSKDPQTTKLIGDSGAESKMLDTEVGEEPKPLQLLPKIESVDQCDKNTDLDSQSVTVGEKLVVERREAPDSSGMYTKEEFLEYYGGYAEWDAACSEQQNVGGAIKKKGKSSGTDGLRCSQSNNVKETIYDALEQMRKKYSYPQRDIMAIAKVEEGMEDRIITQPFYKDGLGLRLRQIRAVVVSWVDPHRKSLVNVRKGMKLLRLGAIDVDETTSLSELARIIKDYYTWKKPLLADFVDTKGLIVSTTCTKDTLGLRLMIWDRLVVDKVDPCGRCAGKVAKGMYVSAIGSHNFYGTLEDFKRIVGSKSSSRLKIKFVSLDAHRNYLYPEDNVAHFFSPRLGERRKRKI